MTREDAIKVLRKCIDNSVEMTFREWEEFDKELAEAIDMVIEALSAVCDDCIWHVCNYNKVDWDAPYQPKPRRWIPVRRVSK